VTKPPQRVGPDDQPSVGPRRRKAVAPTLMLLPPEHLAASDEVIASEAASLLRISERTLRRYVSEGLLPAIKFKRSIRFRRSDLTKYAGVKPFNTNE
jgi:excisionase family DNA binding protein